MSRIGKKPIELPQGVSVELKGQHVKITGRLGSLEMDCHPVVKVRLDGNKVFVENPTPENRFAKQMHGTTSALIANMVKGVSEGYSKKLEIYGTGYNVKQEGSKLLLNVGFANAVALPIPAGIKVQIEVAATKGNEVPAKLTVSGLDKQLVGEFAAVIRRVRPPEPYLGKGIRYAGEVIERKVGKAFASGGAK
ncbi:MAG: 50S ribosomal protein L6 [Sedimentisphaerales bacterium]|jgi:large subunit ribosomal protein L6|nr:50S ribosomal protein L6 [Sedimentisphaerales bacterium]